MITLNEVRQIIGELYLENMGVPNDDLSEGIEDISCIVYRINVFECNNTVMIERHVDIEYSYGEYYGVCEGTSLFQFICTLCNLPLLEEEQEMIIYQK